MDSTLAIVVGIIVLLALAGAVVFMQKRRSSAMRSRYAMGMATKLFLAGGLSGRSAQRRMQVERRIGSERSLASECRNDMIGWE